MRMKKLKSPAAHGWTASLVLFVGAATATFAVSRTELERLETFRSDLCVAGEQTVED
jgi:hypothetical protein